MPADLAVIGLGHLGLPLAQAATAAGISTLGYDPDPHAATPSGADGPLSATEIRRLLAAGFCTTADPAALGKVRTAVICAATPLGADRALDLTGIADAARTLAARLRPHTTVILESAAYPGTTEDFLRPLLEEGSGLTAGRDFHLACSPSRHDPGNRIHRYRNTPKVIGGRQLLRPDHRQGRTGPRPPRGRDVQTAGDQLPARQHRPDERDGGLLP